MNIAGIGVVFARGRGVAALEQALQQGWVPPTEVEVRGLPVYAVAPETLSDKLVLSKARRADRFARMAVLAASDAMQDSGLAGCLDKQRMGVILATALGPHVTTFGFLDGILDFGDAAVSPTAFSHSVHNAAASYVAMTLDIRGPTLTVTHFHFAFQQAVLLAQTWLQAKRCDAVLVGVAEELGAVLQYVCGRMLKPAADGRIKPFAFSQAPEIVPGEGSVFFLLTRESAGSVYARIATVGPDAPACSSTGGLQLLDTFGMTQSETAYQGVAAEGALTAGYAPLFGSSMTGSAFHAAVGALMLKRQMCYACPVQDNPHGITICRETASRTVRDVVCMRLDCAGRPGVLHLMQ